MTTIAITPSSFDLENLDDELRAQQITRNPHGRTLTEDEALELLSNGAVGVIAGVEPITERVLEAAPALRAIARLGTGTDSVDLDAAAERDVAVSNTPDAPVDAVAELTIGLILAALRTIPRSDAAIRAGDWPRPRGHLLRARTVGLIGGGRIGAAVARLAAAFGAEVLVADPLLDAAPEPARLVALDELLDRADVVSLHVPLTDDTRHLLGERELERMRPGTLVVNASRGGLVDEAALEAALRSGHLGGAAIDAFEAEPYTGGLVGLDNVVLSPHAGSSTVETRRRMEREASANLLRDLRERGAL